MAPGNRSSGWRQFAAVLHKNFILQTRHRASFGLGGWAALLLQILVPVAFFSLMCIPKHYIKPYVHPQVLDVQDYDIDTKWWAGASPYEGPALAAGGNAKVMFAPDSPQLRSLLQLVAKAMSCPLQPYKRLCSSTGISNFYCLFGISQAPPAAGCQNATTCMGTPACYAPALANHLLVAASEQEALAQLEAAPDTIDALVVFRSQDLLTYGIRMNHTDAPSTEYLQDFFDVSPGIMPVPGNMLWEYRAYWFFVNLQLAIDRALLGSRQGQVRQHGPELAEHVQTQQQQQQQQQQQGEEGQQAAAGQTPASIEFKVKPFPWPEKAEDLGAASAAAFFNLLLVYAFLAPTRAVVGAIVREKELRLREGMLMLGLTERAYWASWALTHWATLAASGALCALVGLYPFRNSSLGLMLAFYWLFSASLIAFSYCLSTLFSASRVAGSATQFIYALSMIPGFILPFTHPYGGTSWYIACLSPTSAASLFAAALVNWERLSAGVTRQTLMLPVAQESSFCVWTVYWMLALDVVIFALLTWYCDKVLPSTYGQRLPPWFPLLPSYWRSDNGNGSSSSRLQRRSKASIAAHETAPLLPLDDAGSGPAAANGPAQVEQAASGPAVRLVKLRKVFGTSDGQHKVAVDDLSLDMAAGRITALLGHNGAGKTTAIHMLTGMLQPTSGTAFINGCNISTHMSTIRQSLGICPQFDILWPDITVREHLRLYSVIKGSTWGQAAAAAVAAAAEVGLTEKLDVPAGELSGGQRRKLSAAIAFLGSPSVVFLDEPTSGMDPYSRRFTWDIIREHRTSSAVVLTTHSMEEADLLSDHIAVMAEGRLVAQGSSLELKAQYGVGYTLTLVMAQPERQQAWQRQQAQRQQAQRQQGQPQGQGRLPLQEQQGQQQGEQQQQGQQPRLVRHRRASSMSSVVSSSSAFVEEAAEQLMELVLQHVPGAQVTSAAGAEVGVRLPREHSSSFAQLLRELEANKSALAIQSYGLSVTTLEEVFLSITSQVAAEDSKPKDATQRSLGTNHGSSRLGKGSGNLQSVAHSSSSQLRPSNSVQSISRVGGDSEGRRLMQDSSDDQRLQGGSDDQKLLHGWRLWCHQLKALAIKRMLCARRDKLAFITQLVVPLLLVYIALWVADLSVKTATAPPLLVGRETCLLGAPSLLAASLGARNGTELDAFMDAYPRDDVRDSHTTGLMTIGAELNSTLEGRLLASWYSGHPHYDALMLKSLPPPWELCQGQGVTPRVTLLVNQSAICALPAALNQATSALLRYMLAGTRHPSVGGLAMSPGGPSGEASSELGWQGLPDADGAQSGEQGSSGAMGSGGGGSRRDGSRWLGGNGSSSTATAVGDSSTGAGGGGSSSSSDDRSSSSGSNDSSSRRLRPVPDASREPCISVTHEPLPVQRSEPSQHMREDAGSLMLVLCLTMASSVLSAAFVVFLVREQDNKSKHVQMVSGAPPTAFWLANYLWDMATFSLPATGILLLLLWFDLPQLSGPRMAAVAALLWMFGAAGLSATYMLHFLFQDEMKALQRLNTTYFIIGYLGFLTTWVMDLIAVIMHPQHLTDISASIKRLLRLLSPHYCFARGVYDVQQTYGDGGGLPIPGFSPHHETNPFAPAIFGAAMGHLAAQAAVYGLVALALDLGLWRRVQVLMTHGWKHQHGLLRRRQQQQQQQQGRPGSGAANPATGAAVDIEAQQPEQQQRRQGRQGQEGRAGEQGRLLKAEEDEDVAAERLAVQAGTDPNDWQLLLDGVFKRYSQGLGRPPVRAVDGLWVRVPPGECFGLLGVNGAGKTTTFKVITGEVTPDEGDAYIAGFSVLSHLAAARQLMGYCPQFEALPGAMTGREVLHMYARLRGVPEGRVVAEANHLLSRLGLSQLADTACGTYSGGNKRKLSVAVALVGDPPVALLDEPSTGMDPAARRFLWDVLQAEVLASGRTVILTSHSMEECEALCSRIGIMAAGRLQCLGSVQRLKSRFGEGYSLQLRLGQGPEDAAGRVTEGAAATAAAAAAATTEGGAAGEAGATGSGGSGVPMPGASVGTSGRAGSSTRGTASHAILSAADGMSAGVAPSASATSSAAEASVLAALAAACPGASVVEREPGRLLLRLPAQGLDLAAVFEAVEGLRGALPGLAYSLSQTTLEEVFIAKARQVAAGAHAGSVTLH